MPRCSARTDWPFHPDPPWLQSPAARPQVVYQLRCYHVRLCSPRLLTPPPAEIATNHLPPRASLDKPANPSSHDVVGEFDTSRDTLESSRLTLRQAWIKRILRQAAFPSPHATPSTAPFVPCY